MADVFIKLNQRVTTKPESYTANWTNMANYTSVTKWWRDGQFLYISGHTESSGAGSAGAITLALPGVEAGSPLIDVNYLTASGATNATHGQVGNGYWFDSGVGWKGIYVIYASTTTVSFANAAQLQFGNQFAAGDSMNFTIKVPIELCRIPIFAVLVVETTLPEIRKLELSCRCIFGPNEVAPKLPVIVAVFDPDIITNGVFVTANTAGPV